MSEFAILPVMSTSTSEEPVNPKVANLVARYIPAIGKVLLGVLWTGVLWLGQTAWSLYTRVGELERLTAAQDRHLEDADARIVKLTTASTDLLVATKVIEGKLPLFFRISRSDFDLTRAALFGEGATTGMSASKVSAAAILTSPLPQPTPP